MNEAESERQDLSDQSGMQGVPLGLSETLYGLRTKLVYTVLTPTNSIDK